MSLKKSILHEMGVRRVNVVNP